MNALWWSVLVDGERRLLIQAKTRSEARKLAMKLADAYVGEPKRVPTPPTAQESPMPADLLPCVEETP